MKKLLTLTILGLLVVSMNATAANELNDQDNDGGRDMSVCKKTYTECIGVAHGIDIRGTEARVREGCYWELDQINEHRQRRCDLGESCLPQLIPLTPQRFFEKDCENQ